MAERIQEPQLTEPVIVDCVYVTGLSFEIHDGIVRFVGYVRLPELGGEMSERRIVVRFATTERVVRDLNGKIRKALTKGGH